MAVEQSINRLTNQNSKKAVDCCPYIMYLCIVTLAFSMSMYRDIISILYPKVTRCTLFVLALYMLFTVKSVDINLCCVISKLTIFIMYVHIPNKIFFTVYQRTYCCECFFLHNFEIRIFSACFLYL